jgi:Peptidase family M23
MTPLLKGRDGHRLARSSTRAMRALVLWHCRSWGGRCGPTVIAAARPCLGTSAGGSGRLRHRLAWIGLASLLALAASAASDANTGTPADAQPTAVLVSATNAPLRVPGSDGLEHLEYDLLVTNVFVAPATLTALEVTTPDGHSLLQLSGEALAAVTEPLLKGAEDMPGSQVPASGSRAVVIDVAVPPGQVPERLDHRLTYDLPADAPALALIGSREIAGPELVVDPRPPVVLAPPLRGAGWFSLNGCCTPNAHRSLRYAVDGERIIKAETFAIDWVRLEDGFFFTGDGSRNEQYSSFGADVVAVADGTVVFVRDDMPEETPNQPPLHVQEPIDFAGNQVVLQIGPDRWAVYAHLQTGSASVRVGERVTTGQVLARLGNSGNTTAPHLHFVLTDHPNFVIARSVPFVLDRYTLAGFVTPEALEAAFAGPVPGPIAVSGSPQPQQHTHPLVRTVADFPD